MGWLEGVLTGYAKRHYDIEADKRREAELSAAREERMFQTLLSSPYKDIQDYAAAGILDLGSPRKRKGGVAGWMGEIEQTPYLDMIKRTREKVDTDPEYAEANMRKSYYPWLGQGGSEQGGAPAPTPSIPSTSGSVAPPAASGAPPLAQPSTSLVTGGPATAPTPAPTPTPPPAPPGFGRAEPGPDDAGVLQPVPQGDAGAPPAPPGLAPGPLAAAAPTDAAVPPPVPPAGPPLPVSEGPPPPPGLVAAGLPGATTRPVGLSAQRVPPTRMQLPGIFPTAGDLKREDARSLISGKVDAYAEMYKAQGFSDQEAYQKAATLLEQDLMGSGGRSALANAPMEFDVMQPDGTSHRVLGWADRRTQQFTDLHGRPFDPSLRVMKAVPYSAITGDVWTRQALNTLGVHPGEMLDNPALGAQVEAEADRLAGGRAARMVTSRADAGSAATITEQSRAPLVQSYQKQWNGIQAPIRTMEMFLRTMKNAYDHYKAGDKAAWEDFRTAAVHVSEPNSVVMPSEFTRNAGIGSLLERIYGWVGKTVEGGAPLPDNIIDEMMRIAGSVWQGAASYGSQQRSAIEAAIADPRVNIPKEQVFGDDNLRYDPALAPNFANPGATPPPVSPPTNTAPPPNPAVSTVPGGTGTYYDAKTGKYVTPGR